jgi:hypothetical protein
MHWLTCLYFRELKSAAEFVPYSLQSALSPRWDNVSWWHNLQIAITQKSAAESLILDDYLAGG